MRKQRLLSLTAVVAGLVLGMGGLALGGSAHAQETPQATVDAAVEAWNAGDAETFMTFFTTEGLAAAVDTEPTLEAVEAAMEETGPIASAELSNLKLEGGVFTGNIDLQFDAGLSLFETWTFTDTADGWLISDAEPAVRPIPPGVPAVDLTVQEYAFVYNEAAIQAADGNFAFSVTNTGEEEHEVVLFEITTDAPLTDVVDAIAESGEDEQPEGVGAIEFLGFFEPGTQGTAIPSAPLGSGRYGLICFVPSPEGVPHAFLGMVSEFEVGSGPVDGGSTGGGGPSGGGAGPITPPSTGAGGLLNDGMTASSALLAMALVLVTAGMAGLFAVRRS